MELQDTTQIRIESCEAAPEQEAPAGSAWFLVRLWAYGGPGQPLSVLTLDNDPEVEELIRSLITGGQGRIARQSSGTLWACFHNPLYALSAAKTLQQRLLTFHRLQPPQQVVASILISSWESQAGPAPDRSLAEIMPASQTMSDGTYSAQILVSEQVFELAHNKPGFQFNPKPVREAGEGGSPEAMYELLWTDESTYGHLREAGQTTGIYTAGRYQVQGELGRGAMGIVYQAFDQLIGRTVALKTISIDRNAPNRKELIERLKREAKAAGGLDHPNIITIYDVGQEDDRVYLSMQFLEGKTLQGLLAEGRLPPLPTLISYAEQICSAVGFAHARGVIHRDLKPANLMLTNQGVIKVLDFGIAKIEDATLTQTGLVVGTPTHMAPEQASDRKVDQRTDIFALGSVFYELFTLEKPFKGDVTTVLYKIMHEDPLPPSIINPALPGGIDAIIRKALAKDPQDRFQSCEEMGAAFAEQAALLKPATPSTPPVAKSAATPTRRPAIPSPNYLLETTALRPPRRVWPWLVSVLSLAAMGAAGWSYYEKVHTGSFPAVAEKFAAAWHRVVSQASGSANAGKGSHQPSENGVAATGAVDPLNAKSADPANSGGTVGTAPATAQTTTGDVPSVPAQSSATSSAAGEAQKPTDNGSPSMAPPQPQTVAQATNSQNEPNPIAPENARPSDGPSSANPAKTSAASDESQDEPPSEGIRKKPVKTPASEKTGPTVEGFSRRDVPELLRQADAAAGRGDYRMARYEYNLILKIDRNNAAARTGLRRVQAAVFDQPLR
jgi:serine/threonine protein kinase